MGEGEGEFLDPTIKQAAEQFEDKEREGDPTSLGEKFLQDKEAEQKGVLDKLGSFCQEKKGWIQAAALVLGAGVTGNMAGFLMGPSMFHFGDIAIGASVNNPENISQAQAAYCTLASLLGGAAAGGAALTMGLGSIRQSLENLRAQREA